MFNRIIILVIIVLIELYFLQAVKTFSQDFSQGKKLGFLYTAYVFAAISILFGILAFILPPPNWNSLLRFIATVVFILLLCKFLGIVFLLVDDIIRLFRWVISSFSGKKNSPGNVASEGINRLKFLSQLAIAFTVIPAVGLVYGMVRGAYRYRVHHVKVPSSNLPESFDGFKIVQLSDIHTGSFMNDKALTKAFEIVLKQNADLILFTGDLVNNESSELNGYEHVFKKLKAPYGVYSVLGNHDYGDYASWEDRGGPVAKKNNLDRLKLLQKDFGWRLLMNEHVALEKNGEKIGLLGIENWGGSHRFPKYGDMKAAHAGTDIYPFKILMSHDPSHWDHQVVKDFKDVDLTLSGHTHGMQLGIEIPGFKWSPVKYIYRNWAGLYKQDNQFLYVNRGLGFLGYPGRLGIWPEITVIELQKV